MSVSSISSPISQEPPPPPKKAPLWKRLLLVAGWISAIAFPIFSSQIFTPSFPCKELSSPSLPPSPSYLITQTELNALGLPLWAEPSIPPERPIEKHNATQWIESHCGNRAREVARQVLCNIQSISHPHFVKQLTKSVEDFNYYLKKDPNYVALVNNLGKSGQWVTSLALPYLKHLPLAVATLHNLEEVLLQILIEKKITIRQVAIFEDASFSGAEMQYLIFTAEGALWSRARDGNFTIYAVVPYHVNPKNIFLDKRIETSGKVKIMSHKKLKPLIRKIPPPLKKEFKQMFPHHNNKPLVYFAHHTPDKISQLASILESGELGEDISTKEEQLWDWLFGKSCETRKSFKTSFLPPASPPYSYLSKLPKRV